MVHNGVEYGIMQAYAEGFNILHEANAGSVYVKAGDAEVAPMENPEDYQYDMTFLKWASYGVVVLWLVLGYSILPLMFYGSDRETSKFDGGVSDSGEGRWTVHAAVDLGVPAPVLTALYERFNSRRLGAFANKIFLNGMRYMFGGHRMFADVLLWISIPFVLSTIYFGIRKGENVLLRIRQIRWKRNRSLDA